MTWRIEQSAHRARWLPWTRSVLTALALAGASAACAHGASVPRLIPVSIRTPGLPGEPHIKATAINPMGKLPVANRVVVRKSLRRLYLMRGRKVLASFKIHLGLDPVGPKERSGDFRTPVGDYYLTRRNPRSSYFLSIQISYPNRTDLARARRHHWNPGGSIMIHGLPNDPTRPPQYYRMYDWTDGCIALSDSDMLAVWLMTRPGTPIDILP